jgi:hypothetical protein
MGAAAKMASTEKSLDLRTGRKDGAYEAAKKGPYKLPKWRRQLQSWRHCRKNAITSLAGDAAAGRANG